MSLRGRGFGGIAMYCKLAERLHYCIVADRPIFLDERRGRYFQLPTRLERSFLDAARSGFVSNRHEDLSTLVKAGIVEICEERHVALPALSAPEQELRFCGAEVLRPRLIAAGVTARLQASLIMKLRPFEKIAQSIRRHRQSDDAVEPARPDLDAQALIYAVQAADRLLGSVDRCFVRSLSVMILSWRAGLAPHFVIAVQADPFQAHCWVQHQTTVLNDHVEHVRRFVPILVL